jgi:multiple sugar transport system permease protein
MVIRFTNKLKPRVIFSRIKKTNSTTRFLLAVLIPSILWYIVFCGLPMLYALYLSFFKWNFLDPPTYVGTQNYVYSLTRDRVFYKSLLNTVKYTLSTVFIGGFIAFIFAFLINTIKNKAASFFRTVFFLPVVCSMAAIAVLWRWLYQPKFGILNSFLGLFGIKGLMWMGSPKTALLSVIIASIWKGLGFTIVIFLAGLQGIPQSLYEAAEVDGASRLQKVRHITIPLLRPTLVFLLVTGMISGLQVFTQMHVLTGGTGGPLDSARSLVHHLYEKAFSFYQMGRAASIAFILFVIIIVLTIIQLKLTNRKVEY